MITPLDILSFESWILLISIFVLIRFYIHKKWQVLKNLNIPHDPPSILGIGHLRNMLKDSDLFLKEDLRLKKKFGYVYGFYFGLEPSICISDPDVLRKVLVTEFSNFRERLQGFNKINGKIMNNGLQVVCGQQWKRIRSTLSSTFSTSKLKEMSYILETCADQMVETLQKLANEKDENGRFLAKNVFGKYSMEVTCSAAFSINFQNEGSRETKVLEVTKKHFSAKAFHSPLSLIFLMFPWTTYIAELCNYSHFGRNTINFYESLVNAILQKKTKNDKSRVDILQLMLQHEITEKEVTKGALKGLTRNEIVANAVEVLTGGYENTANAIIFLAYSLATNKDIQEKLREEVDQSYRDYDGLSFEGLNSMKYLDMCVNETQRMYGAMHRNGRLCEKDITINGLHIPAGIKIVVPLYGMHHDEEHWDEPWEYKPERFEDMSKIDPIIFQPFGAGPRNCIGMKLAMMEVKIAIAKILLNFNLDVCEDTPSPPLKVRFRRSLQPKDDIFLRVTSRRDNLSLTSKSK